MNCTKNREYYNINSADVKKSFFRIGEDVDKYMQASFVLELTEKDGSGGFAATQIVQSAD